VLARVVGLFSGRGYNIESLTVAEVAHAEHLSRITIVTSGPPEAIEQIGHQLERLVPVHHVIDLTLAKKSIERELAMVKVRGKGEHRMEALRRRGWRFYTFIGGGARFMFAWDADLGRMEALVRDLQQRGLWDEVMVSDLKYFDGSLGRIDRVPDDLKALYATAFEIESKWIVDAGSVRQRCSRRPCCRMTGFVGKRGLAIRALLEHGRELHRRWVVRVLAPHLDGLHGDGLARRTALLVVATDLLTWRLLRLEQRLDRVGYRAAVLDLLVALRPADPPPG